MSKASRVRYVVLVVAAGWSAVGCSNSGGAVSVRAPDPGGDVLRNLPPSFRIVKARNEQGCLEVEHEPSGIVLVALPGGAYWMGSPPEEDGHRDDELRHRAQLSPFLIGKYEVSVDEWVRVMGEPPRQLDEERVDSGDDAARVNWLESMKFCQKARLSLPTEAEWEYAYRAGSSTAFPFGDSWRATEAMGPSRQDSFVSQFGLVGMMFGSVMEWCLDAYIRDFYSLPEAGESDPVCAARTRRRVVRGGTWFGRPVLARAARRHHAVADHPEPRVFGLRVVFRLHDSIDQKLGDLSFLQGR